MKRLMVVLVLLFSCSSTLFAAPHIVKGRPEPLELPGMKFQQRMASSAPEGMLLAPGSYPTTTVNILFLRVEFQQDTIPTTTGSGLWSDATYSANGSSDYWVDLAKSKFIGYWKEVSYGLLPVSIDISKVYKLPNPMISYGDETEQAINNLIYDSVITASTDTTLSFSNYDAVLIVHAGVGEETDVYGNTRDDIWSLYYSSNCISHNASGTGCLTTKLKGNKDLNEAIIMPQSDSQDGIVVDPIGVYVHEFGHWLGLPDLYCTAGSACTIDGPGMWSLMSDGSYNADPATPAIYGSSPSHLDAWSLSYLGWTNARMISSFQSLSLASIETIPTPVTPALGTNMLKAQASSGAANQYFLIENRQQVGFDAGLPGHGLLVWLVDEDVINKEIGANAVNNNAARPGVKLIEADGDWALLTYGGDMGSSGDPFPGSTNNVKLTPKTDPSSLPYTNYGWFNMAVASETTGTIGLVGLTIGFGPLPPQNLFVDGASKTLVWDASSGATSYAIYKNGSVILLATTTSPYYTDGAMGASDTYEVTAKDSNGNESQAATGTVSTVNMTISPTNGTKGCFIATAAYGSYFDPHVQTLRNFRDSHLMTNGAGRMFVGLYYRVSPPIADVISRSEVLRIVTRLILMPIVLMIEYPALSVLALMLVVLGALVLRGKKRIKASAVRL